MYCSEAGKRGGGAATARTLSAARLAKRLREQGSDENRASRSGGIVGVYSTGGGALVVGSAAPLHLAESVRPNGADSAAIAVATDRIEANGLTGLVKALITGEHAGFVENTPYNPFVQRGCVVKGGHVGHVC